MLRKLSAILFLFIVSTVIAQDVTFTKEPKASSERGGVKITFAVSAPTDVEVAVVNKQKEIVRHLAAGMLGSNAPEPLKKDALEQNLVWDFKDDFGKKVTPGTYTVRVGLGLAPEFDRTLGHDPNTLGKVRGLAFSPEGELFVLNMGHHLHVGFGSTICNVFDSKGVYKRTVMPYQASCFPDKVKEFGILDLGENGTYPWIHANHFKTIYPFSSAASHQHPVVTADGRFIIAMKVLGKGTMLVAVNSKDGSIPETGSFGPLLGSKDMRGSACLAAASDGKTLYVSGVASQKRYKPIIWKHAVFRAEWSDKEIKPFIGDPEKPGAGKEGLNEPQGVAVDKDGNIYVADRGNNRIAVFSPEGKFLSELPVKGPYMLAVHRTSGAVFVLGGGDPPDNIIKFNSYKDPKQAYTQKIPGLVGSKASLRGKKRLNDYPVFAMDTSGEELVVWIGSANAWDSFRLFRFTEKNGKLGKPEEKGKGSGFRACREIQVDRKREEVYFQLGGDSGEGGRCPRFVKINGMDGTVLKSLSVRGIGSHFALGHDGYVYVINSRKQIFRYDRDLKPVTFTGTDSKNSDPIPGHKYGLHIMGRGFAVDRNGTIFVLHENLPKVHTRYGISVWGPDGKLRKENLVGSLSAGTVSLRIDRQGNLYVGDPVKPEGQIVPRAFKGKVDTAKKNPYHGKIPDHHYPIMYGSILKFAPSGGAGVGPKITGRKGLLAYDVKVGIKDDLWQYFGVSLIPAQHGPYNHYVTSACACEGLRFDVDEYGRVFSPDAGRFRVVVLDTNGNEIGTFGRYGNQDSAGPESLVPEPGIPLAWPCAVGVSDRAIYVSDILNRRIVRVKLAYKKTVTQTVKVP